MPEDFEQGEGQENWYGEDVATFGDRLAGARDAAGMSQSQFARRLGVKLSTIRGWEQDLSEPRANKLQMMAGLLGVSVGWLLTGEGEGIEGDPEAEEMAPEITALMDELREARVQMKMGLDRLARLEKKLRSKLKEPAENV